MRKFLLLFVFSLLLFSCKSSITSSPGSFTSVGVIRKIGVTTYMYGSHSLHDKDGRLLLALKSSSVNLDKYENKMVLLSGDKINGYPVDGGPEYISVLSVTPLN